MEVGFRRKAYWCVRDFDSRLWWQLQVIFYIFNRINTICVLEIKLGMYFSNSSSHLGVVFSSDNPCGSSSNYGIFLH